jgi:hypothetical protein
MALEAVLVVAAVVVVGYFLSGYQTFSSGAVASFLSAHEDDVNEGRTDRACARLSTSMRFDLTDASVKPPMSMSGGKDVLCEHYRTVARIHKTAPIADRHHIADISVKRSLTNWNLAHVTYVDHHEIEFFPARNKIKTQSLERMDIAKSGEGLQIRRFDSATAIVP